MNIIESIGMAEADILSSARIAMLREGVGVEVVRTDTVWRVAGMGLVGGVMKPFSDREVLDMIRNSDKVVVMKTVDSDTAYVVRNNA